MGVQPVLGFTIWCESPQEHGLLGEWFAQQSLQAYIQTSPPTWSGALAYNFSLAPQWQHEWVQSNNTLNLLQHMKSLVERANATALALLELEIIVALLATPYRVQFPSGAEFFSSIRIRQNIALASAKTALAFKTDAAERPADSWIYDEDLGFTVRPGVQLIDALIKATQPEATGQLYSFSCYRATEYVIMLGIAQELAQCNSVLLASLQRQCEKKVIRSGQFHDVFLCEYGSQDAPVAPLYYVPGDRVWFRNPDEHSSDVAGFEGSWVIYLGGGLFSNFWKRDQPFTMHDKCLEIYHWRHGVVKNSSGELFMDETEVERQVALTRLSELDYQQVLAQMMQPRAAKGIYSEGGCVDTTRESPRWVCPGSADLAMPV